MYVRPRSLSKVYQTCYPVAVTSYIQDDVAQSTEDVFENLEEERLILLLGALSNTLLKQVLRRISKVLEIGDVVLSPLAASKIIKELVYQGEREPYGVRGGTLVVLFCDRLGNETKMGKFPMDVNTNSTYEMHLTLKQDANLKVKMANMMRKMAGLEPVMVLSPSFKLEKKKLYRSSTSSVESL